MVAMAVDLVILGADGDLVTAEDGLAGFGFEAGAEVFIFFTADSGVATTAKSLPMAFDL